MGLKERFYEIKRANEFKKLFKILLSSANEQGWKVKPLDSGHYQFMPPDKSLGLVTISGTPSDWRAWANIKSDLVKRGFKWPWTKDWKQAEPEQTNVQPEAVRPERKTVDYAETQELSNLFGDYQAALELWQEEQLAKGETSGDRVNKELERRGFKQDVEINNILNSKDMTKQENIDALNQILD